jgi:hypothetical protein
MFVGHYEVSFAAKRVAPMIPLWALFIAVQLLDVFWAPFILLGIEKVRIVPGITASNPLDLYYMPYTHSLLAALLWSAGALLGCKLFPRWGLVGRAAFVVALAVFSHWVLDFLVRRAPGQRKPGQSRAVHSDRGLGAAERERYDAFGAACAQFTVTAPHHHLNMIGASGGRMSAEGWLVGCSLRYIGSPMPMTPRLV